MATEYEEGPANQVAADQTASTQVTSQSGDVQFSDGPKYLFGLVCLIIPLLYWPPAHYAASIPREMLVAICAGLGLFLFAVASCRTHSPLPWHSVFLLLLMLLVWAGASYYWSVDRGSSLLGITQIISFTVLAMLATRLSSKAVQEYVLPVTLIAASLAALIGIGQHFGFNPLLLRQGSPPASTFLNVNYAANYFDLITPVALGLLLLQPHPTRPLALLAATAFTSSLGFLIVCQSRGSWLGLVVASVALAILILRDANLRGVFLAAVRRHHRVLIFALLVVVTLGYSPAHVGREDKFSAMLSSTSPDPSVHLRLQIYQNALAGFADHPWQGVGYGAFSMGFSPYLDAVQPIEMINQNMIVAHMHSDPLQMFFELGLPGGLLSLAIYLLVIVMAWRIVRSNAAIPQRLLGLGLLLALLASGAHACVDFPLRLPTSAFFFWFWSGLVIGLYLQVFPGKALKLSRVSLVVIGLTGLTFSAYAASLYQGYLRANRDVRTAMLHAVQHDCKTVYSLTDKAMNEFGLDYFTRFWYAKVYTYCDAPANIKEQAMNRILALEPNMPLPYLTRGQIRFKNGDLGGAAADFNAFRKLLPHRPEGYIGLGQVANHLNDKKQARYWLEKGQFWLERTRSTEGNQRSNAKKENDPSNSGVKNSTK